MNTENPVRAVAKLDQLGQEFLERAYAAHQAQNPEVNRLSSEYEDTRNEATMDRIQELVGGASGMVEYIMKLLTTQEELNQARSQYFLARDLLGE